MRNRILITGACGFTGRHLIARLAIERPAAITGLGVGNRPAPTGWTHVACDLTDEAAVDREVAAARPEVVFHLAGAIRAASADAFRRINVEGFRNLCSALRRMAQRSGRPVRMVAVGSAAEIGSAGMSHPPVNEDVACVPESDYGRSKWEATQLALAEPPDGLLQIVVARAFNLIGPGQGDASAPGSFARQVLAVAAGRSAAVKCGRLDTRRDFVDVRDAAEAYLALARHGRPGQVYNVCAGRSHRIGDLLDYLIDAVGGRIPVVAESLPARQGDVADIFGDHAKIVEQTGWQPRISIEQSLSELLGSPYVRLSSLTVAG
ncbi:MAG: NAD-dependent epimerase/dehydratase family protein [Rhodopirellula sp.]|nr:NAD-dependent epimerase/dehydratase family protein [Rhodopirellula sp.]